MDVIELGGSIGANTCAIARKSRRVITVEADPALAVQLTETITRNFLSNVTVVPKALAVGFDTVLFERHANNVSGQLGHRGIAVPATSLTALLREHGIGDYALVSDCEGAEVEILKKEPEALARCRLALIEMGGLGYSDDDVAEMFEGLGYRITYRRGPCAVLQRS
jgi:FkbM family methyltransferase